MDREDLLFLFLFNGSADPASFRDALITLTLEEVNLKPFLYLCICSLACTWSPVHFEKSYIYHFHDSLFHTYHRHC